MSLNHIRMYLQLRAGLVSAVNILSSQRTNTTLLCAYVQTLKLAPPRSMICGLAAYTSSWTWTRMRWTFQY